jgi:hypothetical protein
MSNFQIMADNMLSIDQLNTYNVSSFTAGYPIQNLLNPKRRSKVWRSAGYWNIDSSNNVIIFQETVGVNKTATISPIAYSSTSAFLAAIVTAMNSAGSSTYTCTTDATTGKIKITSSGTGGGGIFTLKLSNAGFTAASILGFATGTDLTGALTYTADLLRIHTEEWVKLDLGTSLSPKAFIAIGPRNQAIQISPTATITLQGNDTDVWTSPSYSASVPYNDSILALTDTNGLHTSGLRYWRLKIVDYDNPAGYVEIGCIYLGDIYSPDRGRAQFPLQVNPVDASTTVYSEGGYSFTDQREQTDTMSLNIFGLTIAEKEDLETITRAVGASTPFYLSIDPNSAIGSSANYYFKYVKCSQMPQFELPSPGVWSCNFNVREEL